MDDDLVVNTDVDLAELHQGMIDDETLAAYFCDLELTEILEVLVKGAAQAYAKEGHLTLKEGRERFEARDVRGLQIRYRYDGDEWWDTLLRLPVGVRLVRVRHDFGALQ